MKKSQVFLFHHAGGNIYSFRFLDACSPNLQLIPLELPGRGKRMNERLTGNFDSAARDMALQVLRHDPQRGFILFGHSMGALLALKAAQLLEERGIPPGYLVVSGNPGPGVKETTTRYLLGREEFKAELRKLGGMPPEIYTNADLFDFFEPILRSDFKLTETVDPQIFGLVQCPIYAMMGTEEEYCEEISNWRSFTRAGFGSELIEGDHFFIYRHGKPIADILDRCHCRTLLTVKQNSYENP